MTLGPSLVGMLSELTQLSASDGETFALLCKGEASDPAECRSAPAAAPADTRSCPAPTGLCSGRAC